MESNDLSSQEVLTRSDARRDGEGKMTTVVLSINVPSEFGHIQMYEKVYYVQHFGCPIIGIGAGETHLTDLWVASL